jgi:hypothetical protein
MATLAGGAFAQSSGDATAASETPDFVYRARAGDTLIGLAQRALLEPRRWVELQRRNRIADPRRLQLGFPIRIPAAWLKQSPQQVEVLQVIGGVSSAGAPVAAGARLLEGALIETAADGYATLRTAEGGLIIVQAGSRVVLERLRRYDGLATHDTRVKLEAGAANSSVAPGNAVGRFEIATPVAVSAVRGTDFRTRFDGSATLSAAEVTDGQVEVLGSAGGSARLPRGFGTTTDSSGVPARPVALLEAPRLIDPPARAGSAIVTLRLAALPGAVAYRAQVARDAEMTLVVADVRATEPTLTFNALTDGSYHARVLGVDGRGLEGFPTAHAFEVFALPPPPAIVSPVSNSKHSGAVATLQWAPVEAASAYRVQVARDPAFADLLATQDEVAGSTWQLPDVAPGRYYWRVASLRRNTSGTWSDVATFEQKALPQPPTARAERDTGLCVEWSGEAGQTFRLQVARDAKFEQLRVDTAVQATTSTTRDLAPGAHWVRVQAIDADGYVGPWSDAVAVEVPAPAWVKWMPVVSLLLLL